MNYIWDKPIAHLQTDYFGFLEWANTTEGYATLQNMGFVLGVFALIAAVLAIGGGKDKAMRKEVREEIEDAITDKLLDMCVSGKLGNEEAAAVTNELGDSCKLPGLLDRARLKYRDDLKARLKAKKSVEEPMKEEPTEDFSTFFSQKKGVKAKKLFA